jgi:hypothetical protein
MVHSPALKGRAKGSSITGEINRFKKEVIKQKKDF